MSVDALMLIHIILKEHVIYLDPYSIILTKYFPHFIVKVYTVQEDEVHYD